MIWSKIYAEVKNMNLKYNPHDLEKNINKYMDVLDIDTYGNLLKRIAAELGYKGPELYEYVEKERTNFSKMITGARPLKIEYIIPLETIFGCPLAKIIYPNDYYDSLKKEDIPFVKSLRFYALKDDPKMYKELDNQSSSSGYQSIFQEHDEFGKSFIDYVIQYNSINAIKYLAIHRKLRISGDPSSIYATFDGNEHWFPINQIDEFVEMILKTDDPSLFNRIFDIEEYLNQYPFRIEYNIISNPNFLDLLLKTNEIFASQLHTKNINFYKANANMVKKEEREDICFVNVTINKLLEFALKDVSKYKDKIIQMLKFGIDFNEKTLSKLDQKEEYWMKHQYYFGTKFCRDILGNLIVCNTKKTGDKEIDELISRLPVLGSF